MSDLTKVAAVAAILVATICTWIAFAIAGNSQNEAREAKAIANDAVAVLGEAVKTARYWRESSAYWQTEARRLGSSTEQFPAFEDWETIRR